MRFLISRLSSLGDVVCTLPAAGALKAGFPDCEVTWIVDKRFADVVRCCSAVAQVVESKSSRHRSDWPELSDPFDVVFDLQGLLKSALPVALAKGSRKLGYHRQREGAALFSRAVLPDPSSFHVVDQYVDVVRATGGIADRAEFNLKPSQETASEVRRKLDGQNIGSFVALNPGAGWPTKRWPEGNCVRFVDLIQSSGTRVVLIGGKSEEDLAIAGRISSQCKTEPARWTGETSIMELIALLDFAVAHVGGDTGSTHIAAALGKPAIGLYSITNPRRSCPYGQIDRCLYDPASLGNISAERVFELVREVLV